MENTIPIKEHLKSNMFWNMVFSMLNAGQSMILLIIVNRFAGENASGIFSFAFSVAVLMMYIGNFGIRNYQVSDTIEHFSFAEYCGSRIVSCLVMIGVSVGYVIFHQYDVEKSWIILLLCGMRLVECMEDVIHGRYQQKGRLDLACIQGSIRIMLSLLAFTFGLWATGNLLQAVCVYTICNLVCFLMLTICTVGRFGGMQFSFNRLHLTEMFLDCFPLFCGYFFSTYIGNVSKYAIDRFGSEEMQAYYNMIFMPVLVINLVSTMIFRPVIVHMAELWNTRQTQAFQGMVKRQLLIIIGLSVVMLPLMIWIGLPILTLLYGTELSMFRIPFLILLSGGVCSAMSSFLNVCIITIRQQKKLLIVIGVLSVLAAVSGGQLVRIMGMNGAALLYLILTVLQVAGYLWIEWIGSKK